MKMMTMEKIIIKSIEKLKLMNVMKMKTQIRWKWMRDNWNQTLHSHHPMTCFTCFATVGGKDCAAADREDKGWGE